MARQLLTQPIGEADLVEYLKAADDFHFELEIVKACKARNIPTAFGGTYEDPTTKKTRQFDIRADCYYDRRMVRMAVECKCLKAHYPLLVSRIPRTDFEAYHEVLYSFDRFRYEEDADRPSLIQWNTMPMRASRDHSIYPIGGYVGKSTTQVGRTPNGALTSEDSEVFDKWSQALASADDMISGVVDRYEKYPTSGDFTIVLPLLVIPDGSLWAVDYDEDGVQQGNPKQVDEVAFFIGKDYWYPIYQFLYTISHLHIYTTAGFAKFLDRLANKEDPFWVEFCHPERLKPHD